jgi:hypothetical protein
LRHVTSRNVTPPPLFRAIAASFRRSCACTAGHPGLADQQEEKAMKNLVLALGVAGGMFASAGLIGSLVTAANAQEKDVLKVDANSDGMVTLEEAIAAGWNWTEDQFSTADKDQNGSLSADEFVSATDAS